MWEAVYLKVWRAVERRGKQEYESSMDT